MKLFVKIFSAGGLFFLLNNYTYGQRISKDIVYYLIDSAKVPVKDRMFLVGQEGNLYGYKLTCECLPFQNDAIFIRLRRKQSITTLTREDFKKLKLISLRQLIHIAALYGLNKEDKTVFYFIEPNGRNFTQYQVYLKEPEQPINDAIKVPSQ